MRSKWLTLSSGIKRIAYITSLFDVDLSYFPSSFFAPTSEAIVGWGRKPTANKSIQLASKRGCDYIALEDGFLRSLDLGVNGALPHSLVMDKSGIYYDSTKVSDLENLILNSVLTEAQVARSRLAIAQIKSNKLSKYNLSQESVFSFKKDAVLLVDQTYGDVSIEYGLADVDSFKKALRAALQDNPESDVLIKVHPDVIADKKRGYCYDLLPSIDESERDRCHIISENVNPWSLFDAVKSVYVVTSQMGFEALMAGLPVYCFGMPFYAGWGLTQDALTCERRGKSRTLEQVFYAAYIQYAHYINPYTHERCEIEDTIRLLSEQRRYALATQGIWRAVGFGFPKNRFISQFLGPLAEVSYSNTLDVSDGTCNLVWSSALPQTVPDGADINRMEDGFIRSSGLGVDLIRPLSLVIDRVGIYYDASRPSGLENMLNTESFYDELIERAQRLRHTIISEGVSKYNLAGKVQLTLPKNKRLILVPGQVETDASIALGSPDIQTNRELLARVRDQHPDAWLIYKPHPDVVAGARYGELSSNEYYDQLIERGDISELIDRVDEVHTMTSLTGFEALMRGRKVVTYGMPFYAGWGLTEDRLTCPRRKRILTLDMLVAATLILYPTYVDPKSGDVIDAETAVGLLLKSKKSASSTPWWVPFYRLYRAVFEGKQ